MSMFNGKTAKLKETLADLEAAIVPMRQSQDEAQDRLKGKLQSASDDLADRAACSDNCKGRNHESPHETVWRKLFGHG